jgi:glucose/arabinose dehydrogenase
MRLMLVRFILALLVCACCTACDKKDPETPNPGNQTGDIQVRPGDRLGWTQTAADTADISSLQFALYVDGTRTTLSGVSCTPAGTGFDCSAVLPTLTPGPHQLELASFVLDGSVTAESPRSAALRVIAVTSTTSASAAPQFVTTADQVRLTLTTVADGLQQPSDLAFVSDGTIFIAERGGIVRTVRGGAVSAGPALNLSADIQLPEGGLLAIAADPKFDDNGQLYALYAAAGPRDGSEFVVARFRYAGGTFGERAVLLDRTPASPDGASGALRIGPDGKIYLALDSSADEREAASFATYNGKVLRLNTDATTPDDQPGGTPILSFDHPQPYAIDWQPKTGTLWVVDRLDADAGRLSAVAKTDKQSRASGRTSYALPAGTGAASAVFYRGDLVPLFRENLFIAGESGRELMRLRFDPQDPSKVSSVERLLKDEIGPIHVVAEGPDGALYVATSTTLFRLAP